jgi:hypothetical protein
VQGARVYFNARRPRQLTCLLVCIASLALSLTAIAQPLPANDACAALVNYQAPAVTITSAKGQSAGPITLRGGGPAGGIVELPAHCLLTGAIDDRTGVNGKRYAIKFELRLPADWNGRFLFQGGGGVNGFVAPAVGSVKGPPALSRGFAVVTQDAGHEGTDASFGEDQQSRIDMEYRSYERVTAVAKQLVRTYYGKPADRSYFMGCSEGGREALLASQRMPLEYDGVVAGDPGFMLGVTFYANADRMTIASMSPKLPDGKPDYSKAFSERDLQLIQSTVATECDAKDGLTDGLIDNPFACHPNLEHLICKAGRKTDACLLKAQVAAVRTIIEGGRPVGQGIASEGYFYDTGVDLWKGKFSGKIGPVTNGVGSIQGLFSTPYDPSYDDTTIDFAKEGGRFTEVGALNRADGVMYSSFLQHGGKLLLYTGLSDPAFSAKELLKYYQRLTAANGGPAATEEFARLFLVPGMTHCGGGRALDTFDPLQAVVEWVEHAEAPKHMIATGSTFPGRSRPLCAYPTEARYTGAGSIEQAENFECRTPVIPAK